MLYPDERKPQRRVLGPLSWAVFALGVLLQLSGPPLLISGNHFVVSEKVVEQSKLIEPAAMVGRFRRARVVSAMLALGGALGLAFCYRQALFRRLDETASSDKND